MGKKLTIIVGSNGHNLKMGETILGIAREEGFDPELIDLCALNLPMYIPNQEGTPTPDAIPSLVETIKNSHAVVVLAPEYNGLIPPVLNNAIAWISVTTKGWRDAFNGKPGIIGTFSGGAGAQALVAMRLQLSYIGMNIIGRQLSASGHKALNEDSVRACLSQVQ
jgi:NAD(P)H-dependent FMN reductase